MPAYFIVQSTVKDDAQFQKYRQTHGHVFDSIRAHYSGCYVLCGIDLLGRIGWESLDNCAIPADMTRRASHEIKQVCTAVVCAGVIATTYITLPLPWVLVAGEWRANLFCYCFAVHALQERNRFASLYNERLFDLPPEVARKTCALS